MKIKTQQETQLSKVTLHFVFGHLSRKQTVLPLTQLATGIVTCLLRGKLKEVKLDPITFLLGVCLSYCLHCSLYNLIVPIKTTLLIIFSMTKHEILGTFAEFDKNFAFSPSQTRNGNFPFSISYYESKKNFDASVDVLISCKT